MNMTKQGKLALNLFELLAMLAMACTAGAQAALDGSIGWLISSAAATAGVVFCVLALVEEWNET
jgi:hypothetical protein